MATIHIPTPLRKFTEQNRQFTTGRKTVAEAIEELVEEYPEVKKNLLDENGQVRSYIKVYVGEQEITAEDINTYEIDDKTEISIIPAIAGGREAASTGFHSVRKSRFDRSCCMTMKSTE